MTTAFAPLNWTASFFWSVGSALARKLASKGLLRTVALDCRVISVGNLQAGGAGKTPLVAQIAREAIERKLTVCILSRGYGGEWENKGGMILPGQPTPDARLCGDEAALLHDLVPEAAIGIGADRVGQFLKVREGLKKKIEVAILDDGFQHWKIRKDLEIVALTSARPTEVLFREFLGAIDLADLVVWTKGEDLPAGLASRYQVKVRYRLPKAQSSTGLWIVTGIAQGSEAADLAKSAGYRVVKHIQFRDHARYDLPVIQDILKEARQVGCQVGLTGKDWVKWRDLGIDRGQVIVLEPELEFEGGREIWNQHLWGY